MLNLGLMKIRLDSASLPTGRQVTGSRTYGTLKRVQGDKSGLFTRSSIMINTKIPMIKIV